LLRAPCKEGKGGKGGKGVRGQTRPLGAGRKKLDKTGERMLFADSGGSNKDFRKRQPNRQVPVERRENP